MFCYFFGSNLFACDAVIVFGYCEWIGCFVYGHFCHFWTTMYIVYIIGVMGSAEDSMFVMDIAIL